MQQMFQQSAMNKPQFPALLFWSVLLLFLASLSAVAQGTRAPDTSVQVIAIEGTVEIAPTGTDNWAAAKLNQKLKAGDRLRTGKLSRTTLRSPAAGDMPVRE